ncbi:unnamed protein product, partial [marine sediment metagenome]
YVTKELSKSLAIIKWPRKLRRIRTNQKWPLMDTGDDFDDLRLHWHYLTQTDPESLELLRDETEQETGIETIVLGIQT